MSLRASCRAVGELLFVPKNTSTGDEGSAAVTARTATALGVSAGGGEPTERPMPAALRTGERPPYVRKSWGRNTCPISAPATGGSEGGALHNGAGPAPPGSRCEKLLGKGKRDPPGGGLRVPVRPPAQEGPRAALISLPGPEPRLPAHKGL